MRGADATRGEDVGEAAGEGGDLSGDGGHFIWHDRNPADLNPQGTQCPAQEVGVRVLSVALGRWWEGEGKTVSTVGMERRGENMTAGTCC